MFSCGLLRPQSSNGLLKNFRDFLSLEKKLETLQQDLYHCILAKPSTDPRIPLSLSRKGLLPFVKTKTTVDPVKSECLRWLKIIQTGTCPKPWGMDTQRTKGVHLKK